MPTRPTTQRRTLARPRSPPSAPRLSHCARAACASALAPASPRGALAGGGAGGALAAVALSQSPAPPDARANALQRQLAATQAALRELRVEARSEVKRARESGAAEAAEAERRWRAEAEALVLAAERRWRSEAEAAAAAALDARAASSAHAARAVGAEAHAARAIARRADAERRAAEETAQLARGHADLCDGIAAVTRTLRDSRLVALSVAARAAGAGADPDPDRDPAAAPRADASALAPRSLHEAVNALMAEGGASADALRLLADDAVKAARRVTELGALAALHEARATAEAERCALLGHELGVRARAVAPRSCSVAPRAARQPLVSCARAREGGRAGARRDQRPCCARASTRALAGSRPARSRLRTAGRGSRAAPRARTGARACSSARRVA